MSYAVEWIWAPLVSGMVVLLLIVPVFAVIAVVVATIAVLILALAALASPYLLVRGVRRRLRPAKNTMDPLAERDPGADRRLDRPQVLGPAHVTAFTYDEPREAGAILENATRNAA